MPLYAVDANYKPGRVPDSEAVSLNALLKGNHFTDEDCKKARSAPADNTDLQDRFGQVVAVENQFNPDLKPAERRGLRIELETVYGQLLDAAQRHWDAAEAAYQSALDAEVLQLRSENPASPELYMNIWKVRAAAIQLDDRLAKWVDVEAFRTQVRADYKARYKMGVQPAGAQLSAQDQQAFELEKNNITTQLNNWANKAWNAPGCNENGTWGTSAGGSGNNFNAAQVNKRVWAELKTWWHGKDDTYITPSDTSSWSMKKYRIVADDRSPTINYHINVA